MIFVHDGAALYDADICLDLGISCYAWFRMHGLEQNPSLADEVTPLSTGRIISVVRLDSNLCLVGTWVVRRKAAAPLLVSGFSGFDSRVMLQSLFCIWIPVHGGSTTAADPHNSPWAKALVASLKRSWARQGGKSV